MFMDLFITFLQLLEAEGSEEVNSLVLPFDYLLPDSRFGGVKQGKDAHLVGYRAWDPRPGEKAQMFVNVPTKSTIVS
ncbi:uncharacterized protein EAE98_007227 [Botrytis deweyae]|uniref:Uncharacterized protein n=1 Tax=Botrytis deweyae TaxID=2478750 RepID=A0ABQ7IIF9_9HELO|nr:uncharacterized protein EAE98_007227 [Botrytis deweyae]KAF7925139.1 hypothetical protein EAE98_007227 [Botrytis deweyae]